MPAKTTPKSSETKCKFVFRNSMEPPDHVLSEPIIPNFLIRRASTGVYATAGVGKTHLMADILGSVSQDHPCLAIIPEDPDGWQETLGVWREYYGMITPKLSEWLHRLNLLDSTEVKDFITVCKPLKLGVIGIDGLIYCLGGKSDADTGAMTEATYQLTDIAVELGCAILINHHTGWDGSRERGASNLRGLTRVMCGLENRAGTLRLAVKKSNRKIMADKLFKLEPFGSGAVVVNAAVSGQVPGLSPVEQQIINAMILDSVPDPVSIGQLEKATGLPSNRIYETCPALSSRGYIDLEDGRPKRYTLSDLGRQAATQDSAGSPITTHAQIAFSGTGKPLNWPVESLLTNVNPTGNSGHFPKHSEGLERGDGVVKTSIPVNSSSFQANSEKLVGEP